MQTNLQWQKAGQWPPREGQQGAHRTRRTPGMMGLEGTGRSRLSLPRGPQYVPCSECQLYLSNTQKRESQWRLENDRKSQSRTANSHKEQAVGGYVQGCRRLQQQWVLTVKGNESSLAEKCAFLKLTQAQVERGIRNHSKYTRHTPSQEGNKLKKTKERRGL